ncbi:MAG: hypothetical protein ACI9UJ_002263 [bacterium]|jgi:hypothetical protein
MVKQLAICLCAAIFTTACVTTKPVTLFDEKSSTPEPPHIENFYALSILKDNLNSDVWFTPDVKCIQVKNSDQTRYAGKSAIHLKWDKQEGGCDWIGMGIGWDGWAPKDLSMIMNKAAIQFKPYSAGGKIRSLPLAAAMEDYGGKQAWIGFASKYITYGEGDKWATVTLPISDFGWEEFGADETNVKQMIIQFEAAGNVYFDEIRVVPFKGILDKMYETSYIVNPTIKLDGETNETIWNQNTLEFEGHSLHVIGSNEFIYIGGFVSDITPAMNTKSGDEVWNGDGVELAISTNQNANPKRKQLLLSDQHVGIKMGEQTLVWDWQSHSQIVGAEVVFVRSAKGYSFEAKIPYSHFDMGKLQANTVYNFELAVNEGNALKRLTQVKWNSGGIDGFHKNPSLWGDVIFNEIEE